MTRKKINYHSQDYVMGYKNGKKVGKNKTDTRIMEQNGILQKQEGDMRALSKASKVIIIILLVLLAISVALNFYFY